MPFNPLIHHRHSIRLYGYDYSAAGVYFVTMVAYERACVFVDIVDSNMHLNEWGEIINHEWLQTEKVRSNVSLDQFQIMPNHIHGIFVIDDSAEAAEHVDCAIQPVGATRRVALDTPQRLRVPNTTSITAVISSRARTVARRPRVADHPNLAQTNGSADAILRDLSLRTHGLRRALRGS
jgi:hypothetical protein